MTDAEMRQVIRANLRLTPEERLERAAARAAAAREAGNRASPPSDSEESLRWLLLIEEVRAELAKEREEN